MPSFFLALATTRLQDVTQYNDPPAPIPAIPFAVWLDTYVKNGT